MCVEGRDNESGDVVRLTAVCTWIRPIERQDLTSRIPGINVTHWGIITLTGSVAPKCERYWFIDAVMNQ